jgi:hypothetical protein
MLTRRDWVSIFVIGLFMFPMLAGVVLHNTTTGLFGVGGLLGMIAGLVLRD